MTLQNRPATDVCPDPLAAAQAKARAAFDALLRYCLASNRTFCCFEKRLFTLMAVLGVRPRPTHQSLWSPAGNLSSFRQRLVSFVIPHA
jgi:hypothetical protein